MEKSAPARTRNLGKAGQSQCQGPSHRKAQCQNQKQIPTGVLGQISQTGSFDGAGQLIPRSKDPLDSAQLRSKDLFQRKTQRTKGTVPAPPGRKRNERVFVSIPLTQNGILLSHQEGERREGE